MPDITFIVDFDKNHIGGITSEVTALKQTIYKILHTERYNFEIYDWNYGIQLQDIIGKPMAFIKAQLPYRIADALITDDRITDIFDFQFQQLDDKFSLLITFCIKSIYGDIKSKFNFYNGGD